MLVSLPLTPPPFWAQVAGALFATPPSSTYEEALSFFEEAEARDPGFYKGEFRLMCGWHGWRCP